MRNFSILAIGLAVMMVFGGRSLALAGPFTIGGEFSTGLAMEAAEPNNLSSAATLQLNFDKSVGAAAIYSSILFEDSTVTLDEAYLDYWGDKYDLRAGRQRVVWGTALQINPTDVINPVNIADPMGDKLPVMAVNGTYYLNDWLEISGVYLPQFTPAVERLPMPGITVTQPESTFENSEYALKVKAVGLSGADFSVSYFSGKEDAPTPVSPTSAVYRDQEVIGADFATAIGDVGLWAEAALSQVSGLSDPYLSWIIGGDYRTSNGLYFAAQYALMDKDQGETNLVVGAMEKDFGGIHHWKIGTVYNVDSHAYVLMPEVTYSLADSTSLVLGATVVNDDTHSLAMLGHGADRVRAELTMSF